MSDAVENNLLRSRLSSLNRSCFESPYTRMFNSGASAIERPSTSRSSSMVSLPDSPEPAFVRLPRRPAHLLENAPIRRSAPRRLSALIGKCTSHEADPTPFRDHNAAPR